MAPAEPKALIMPEDCARAYRLSAQIARGWPDAKRPVSWARVAR